MISAESEIETTVRGRAALGAPGHALVRSGVARKRASFVGSGGEERRRPSVRRIVLLFSVRCERINTADRRRREERRHVQQRRRRGRLKLHDSFTQYSVVGQKVLERCCSHRRGEKPEASPRGSSLVGDSVKQVSKPASFAQLNQRPVRRCNARIHCSRRERR